MRRAFSLATCVVLVVLCVAVGPAAARAASRPNFVLCMADDQGWGDVGFRNPKLKTPVLDELARSALHLERFYAAAPVCSPTRGSVLTGRHPNRFGCFSWGYTLRPQEVTVAEALQQVGYATGHFGKWHLGPVTADSPVCPGHSGFQRWLSSPNFFENDPLMSREGRVVQLRGESSMVTVDAALEFIRECARREQPFLAVVWFGSPHSPHVATDELRSLYADQPARLQNFYGEITGIDRAMGKLRAALRQLGIADRTLLWYTSDNGAIGVGSTGGLRGGKGNVYEGGLRVPCMIEWPERIRSPRVSRVPCGTVDIYPTLLELAGATVEHQPPLDGISLVPLLDDRMSERPQPLGFWDFKAPGIRTPSREILEQMLAAQQQGKPYVPPGPDPGKIDKTYSPNDLRGHAAWLDGNWKLHRIAGKRGAITWELYDLASDPQEKHNVAADQPQRTATMQAQLESWMRSVIRSLNGEDYRRTP